MKLLLAAVLAIGLSGCGGPLSLLTGGGPNVAANVQAGKTNTQTLGHSETSEQTITRPKARSIEQSTGVTTVRAERVETVNNTNISPWVIGILMLLAGFLIPSPAEIGRMVWSAGSRLRRSTSQGA